MMVIVMVTEAPAPAPIATHVISSLFLKYHWKWVERVLNPLVLEYLLNQAWFTFTKHNDYNGDMLGLPLVSLHTDTYQYCIL